MKKLVPIIIVILAVILCLSCFMIMKDKSESKAEKDAFDQLTQIVEIDEAEQKDTEPDVLKKRDLTPLVEENPDCVGWIYIEGTEVDYPVMHTPNAPQKYLRLSYEGESSTAGVPFLQETCSVEGDNLIVYGHNMRNGSMFQNLHKFEDEAFFKKHKEVYVYTPKKTYTYTIFAAYKFDDRHLLKTFNFKNKKKFENYLRNVKNIRDMGSHVRKDQEVTSNDKIITLSTCVGGQPNNRYLVQAVLTDERSTK